MAEPLKYLYNQKFFRDLTKACNAVIPDFDIESFLHQIYDSEWNQKELKQRTRHVTLTLSNQLPHDYPAAIRLIIDLVPILKQNGVQKAGFEYTFLPDFIEVFGIHYYIESIQAMEQLTQFITCEFAVRPFLIQYPSEMMRQMSRWSKHAHEAVRRLSSEGCRPRLPWAMAVPYLKKDPSPILPILEILKNDPSESVRRSVANNLNDISKDHPDVVLHLSKKWIGHSDITDHLIKHACRTMLKRSNSEALTLFGFGSTNDLELLDFRIQNKKVYSGDSLSFSFSIENKSLTKTLVRIEYAIYYLLKNGTYSRKVFKISERVLEANSSKYFAKSQSFRPITTRKFYTGTHKLSVIINGRESDYVEFLLII